MAKTKNRNDKIVIGGAGKPSWRGQHKVAITVAFVVILVVAIVLAGVYIVLSDASNDAKDAADRPTRPPQSVFHTQPLTDREIHTKKYVVRGQGTILAVNKNNVVVRLRSESSSTRLKLTGTTAIMRGAVGSRAHRDDLRAGQQAVISYDQKTNTIKSIWVGYGS